MNVGINQSRKCFVYINNVVFKLLQSIPLRSIRVTLENTLCPLGHAHHPVSHLHVLHRKLQILRMYSFFHPERITIKPEFDEGNEQEEDLHLKKQSISYKGFG